MSEVDKYMDESFKKMSEDFTVSYDKSFWEQAKVNLENDSLDDAFRSAATNFAAPIGGGMDFALDSLGEAFMDDAFKDAAVQSSVTYKADFWKQMEADMPNLQMDEAFHFASTELKVSYNPAFWGEANIALEKEGLHYEYQTAYWNEAKMLLDKADRKVFFFKWSGVAAVLLLFSLFGFNYSGSVDFAKTQRQNDSGSTSAYNKLAHQSVFNSQLDNNETLSSLQNQNIAPTIEEDNSTQIDLQNSIERENENNTRSENNTTFDPNFIVQNSTLSNDEDNQDALGNEKDRLDNDQDPLGIENENNDIVWLENNIDRNNPDNQIEENHSFDNEESISIAEQMKLETENIDKVKSNISPIPTEFSSMQLLNEPLIAIDLIKRKPVQSIFLFGGAGYGNSYGELDFTLTKRYNFGLGYSMNGYGKLRNFEFGGDISLNYLEMENLEGGNSKTVYLKNGDYERYWYSFKIYDMFYANTNLFVNYKLNQRHKISLGVGIERLIAAQSNMSHNIDDDANGEVLVKVKVNEISTENNNWGVQKGLRKWDMKLSLGYQFELTNRIGLFAKVNYGLFDRTNDVTYNQNSVFDNEKSVLLGIKYSIFTRIK